MNDTQREERAQEIAVRRRELMDLMQKFMQANNIKEDLYLMDTLLRYGLMLAYKEQVSCARLFSSLLDTWHDYEKVEERHIRELAAQIFFASVPSDGPTN